MTAVDSSKYQIVNGTYYDARTAAEVVRVLEQVRLKHTRIRIHLGDTEGSGEPVSRVTKDLGLDWLDEFDCEGTIGRSMGPIKIPLMITNSRSMGGPGILDHCIVRIRTTGKNGRNLYRHPNYHYGKIVLRAESFPPPASSGDKRTYEAAALVNGQIHARFETMEKAHRWIKKMGLANEVA